MEENLKLLLAKMLGEVYRTQKEQNICQVSEATIFGLLNGFEETIDEQLGRMELITNEEVEKVAAYFAPYDSSEKTINDIPNYKFVEINFEREGVPAEKFQAIVKYLYAKNRFTAEIDKMGKDLTLSKNDV